MAILCRCAVDAPKAANYVQNGNRRYVRPVGYPESSSICGVNGCSSQGRIYLSNDEVIAADNVVGFYNSTIKVLVDPTIQYHIL